MWYNAGEERTVDDQDSAGGIMVDLDYLCAGVAYVEIEKEPAGDHTLKDEQENAGGWARGTER